MKSKFKPGDIVRIKKTESTKTFYTNGYPTDIKERNIKLTINYGPISFMDNNSKNLWGFEGILYCGLWECDLELAEKKQLKIKDIL